VIFLNQFPDKWSFVGYVIIIAMAVLVFVYNNRVVTMQNFKSKFIVQFIMNLITVGIIATIVGRVITALLFKTLGVQGTSVCWLMVLVTGVFNVAAMIVSLILTQNELKKKSLDNIPDIPVKFYAVLILALIILNVVISVIGFSSTYNTCVQNISVISMENDLVSAGTDRSVVRSVVEDQLHSAVRNALIVVNIIQMVILALMTIVISKRHNRIWR
jgi:hypothetical protein